MECSKIIRVLKSNKTDMGLTNTMKVLSISPFIFESINTIITTHKISQKDTKGLLLSSVMYFIVNSQNLIFKNMFDHYLGKFLKV